MVPSHVVNLKIGGGSRELSVHAVYFPHDSNKGRIRKQRQDAMRALIGVTAFHERLHVAWAHSPWTKQFILLVWLSSGRFSAKFRLDSDLEDNHTLISRTDT
jgi:hypothetical protein